MLFTYQTFLTSAFSRVSDIDSASTKKCLSFISRYTINVRHVHGAANLVADAWSSVSTEDRTFEAMLAMDGVKPDVVDCAEMAKQQATNVGVQRMVSESNTALQLVHGSLYVTEVGLISMGRPPPLVPAMRHLICYRLLCFLFGTAWLRHTTLDS